MLILSRRTGERIEIGPEIEVRVLKIEGRRVQLGVAAPAAIAIWRNELRPAASKTLENLSAAE